jgi:hypothetical protein
MHEHRRCVLGDTLAHVASVSHGAAANFWESPEMAGNKREQMAT